MAIRHKHREKLPEKQQGYLVAKDLFQNMVSELEDVITSYSEAINEPLEEMQREQTVEERKSI